MTDHEWIRNLATAKYEDGQWAIVDGERLRAAAGERVRDAIADLVVEAQEAADIYNVHAKGRQMKVLPLNKSETGGATAGLMMLLGHINLSVEYIPHHMIVRMTLVKDFRKASRVLFTFTPRLDTFGDLHWSLDNGMIMNHDMIVKKLFETIVRMAFENGDIGATRS